MKGRQALAGFGLLTMCTVAVDAEAIDLTGVWIGRLVCDSFDALGKSKDVITDDVMLITQTGDDLNIAADGFGFLYNGTVIDDIANPTKKAQFAFIECRTSAASTDTSEIGRAKVTIKTDGISAKLKAQSILSEPTPGFQTCKWSYKRVDTTDPLVPECDAPPLTAPTSRTGNRGHH